MQSIIISYNRKEQKTMTVTFRDELGIVCIHNIVDIQFDGEKAYFTDSGENDFRVKIEHIVSIMAE